MQIDYPYHLNALGLTAQTSDEDHLRDMIEQVLFTSPGERVNRPTFGCGLLQLIFAPNNDSLAAAAQFTVQGSLQQWLGELIQVEAVNVQQNDGTLSVSVQYTVRSTQQRQVVQFMRGGL